MFTVMDGFTRQKVNHDQQDSQSKSLVYGLASFGLGSLQRYHPAYDSGELLSSRNLR